METSSFTFLDHTRLQTWLPVSTQLRAEADVVFQNLRRTSPGCQGSCGFVPARQPSGLSAKRTLQAELTPDAAVRCASTGGQQAVLVRRPGNGLNSSHMLTEAKRGLVALQVPDQQLVVVTSRGELSPIMRPLQQRGGAVSGGWRRSEQAAEPNPPADT